MAGQFTYPFQGRFIRENATATWMNSATTIAINSFFGIVATGSVPVITITNSPVAKISDETGKTTCTVNFTCDIDITQWEARATNGTSPAQGVGLLVGSYNGTSVSAGTQQTFDVTYDELTNGDLTYQITVYGYANGVWGVA